VGEEWEKAGLGLRSLTPSGKIFHALFSGKKQHGTRVKIPLVRGDEIILVTLQKKGDEKEGANGFGTTVGGGYGGEGVGRK